jgi:hypothetical protein
VHLETASLCASGVEHVQTILPAIRQDRQS